MDNVEITPGSGNSIAADEVVDGVLGTVKVQYTKIMDGTPDGTTKLVIGPNGMQVDVQRGGRTPVLKTNTQITTSQTVDQVVLTYTVTSGKTLWLEYIAWDVRLTAVNASASILGAISFELPSGTKGFTSTETNPTTSQTGMKVITFSEPLPVTAGTVIRWVCTPAANTSMTWIGNFGGYEA